MKSGNPARRRFSHLAIAALIALLAACSSSPRATAPLDSEHTLQDFARAMQETESALQNFAQASKAMDYARVAATFTEDGEISHGDGAPVRTAAAIRTFFESFREYKVHDYRLASTKSEINAEGVLQSGTYWQRVTLPSGLTVEASGHFKATWIRDILGKWRLRKMATYSP